MHECMTAKYKNNNRVTPKKINKLNLHDAKGQENSKIMYTLSRTSVVGFVVNANQWQWQRGAGIIVRCTQSHKHTLTKFQQHAKMMYNI